MRLLFIPILLWVVVEIDCRRGQFLRPRKIESRSGFHRGHEYTYRHSDPSAAENLAATLMRKYIEKELYPPRQYKQCSEYHRGREVVFDTVSYRITEECGYNNMITIDKSMEIIRMADVFARKMLSIFVLHAPRKLLNGILHDFVTARSMGFSLTLAVYEKANDISVESMAILAEFLYRYESWFTDGTLDLIANIIKHGKTDLISFIQRVDALIHSFAVRRDFMQGIIRGPNRHGTSSTFDYNQLSEKQFKCIWLIIKDNNKKMSKEMFEHLTCIIYGEYVTYIGPRESNDPVCSRCSEMCRKIKK